MDCSLLPFGLVRLLWWLRRPKSRTLRVPLMGVVKSLQNSRMASTLAFMMIEFIRRDAIVRYGSESGDIGWVLDDNQGMIAVANAIRSDEHTSEIQSLMRTSYAVVCLKKKKE